MPTTVTKTIKSSGGDYTSLSGWDAGEAGDLTGVRDEIAQAECHNLADSTKMIIGGWTTDATRYVRIYAADDHAGVFSTSVYRMEAGQKDQLKTDDATFHCRIEGIQFHLNGGTNIKDFVKPQNTAGEIRFDRCMWRRSAGTGEVGSFMNGCTNKNAVANVYVNCLFYDWNDTTGLGSRGLHGKAMIVYNCTAHNCDVGFNSQSDDPIIKNCIGQDSTNPYAGTWHANSTHNCSDVSDADAPGGNSAVGEVLFVNEGSDDFHLSASDTVAKGAGTDLSSDSLYAFSDDIDGNTRGATWDIGMHQVTAGAADLAPFIRRRSNTLLRM